MRRERRVHLLVCIDHLLNDVRPDFVPHPGRRRGDESLDVELIRVYQESHHRHLVVRLVGDVGHDDDARPLDVGVDPCCHGIHRSALRARQGTGEACGNRDEQGQINDTAS